MKLSEAILLGSINTKQHFGALATLDGSATCAWGAAFDAMGIHMCGGEELKEINQFYSPSKERVLSNAMPLDWRWAVVTRVNCPLCAMADNKLERIIAHLNDTHRQSRPRIAAYVAGWEKLYDPITISSIEESKPNDLCNITT